VKYLNLECQPRKVEDPIFQITEKTKEESQKGEKFIRGYSLDDDLPKVVTFQLGPFLIRACYIIPKHNALYEEFKSPRMPGSFGAHHVVYAEG